MELILFIGLLAAGASLWRLAERVGRLERELARLDGAAGGAAPAEGDPVFAGRPPARVVRSPLPYEAGVPASASVSAPTSPPSPQGRGDPMDRPLAEAARAAPEAGAEPPAATLGEQFERLVGGNLLIWIGGVAVALAGIFLIRYSIQAGYITPPIRMAMATLFGLGLVAGGELARARPGVSPDPRVAQALVGAGVLILYAAAYGSHVLYGLIGIRTAAALMVVVALGALALSLRHGAPTAVMGLLGGFATPLLVGDPSATSVPLLTYLGLLNLALFALAARRGWTWLAAAAVLLSFGWTGILAFLAPAQALPAGLFIVALSIAASTLRAGGGWHLDFIRPAAIGLVELSVLVARVDLGLPAWGLYGLLAAATFVLAGRRSEYRILPAIALVLALALLALKALPLDPGAEPLLPGIALAITLLFALGGLPGALRGARRLLPTAIASAAFAGPVLILRLAQPALLARPLWGLLLVAAAAGPLFLAWARRREAGPLDPPRAVAAGAALLLLTAAAWHLAPALLVGSVWLALALAASVAAARLADRGVGLLAVGVAGLAILWTAASVPDLWATVAGSLLGQVAVVTALPAPGRALQLLALPAPLLYAIGRALPAGHRLRALPFALVGLFGGAAAYILFKQLFHLSNGSDFIARAFAERTVLNQALFLAGWLICTGRLPLPGLDDRRRQIAGILLTALAAARLVWFDMIVHNPAATPQHVGSLPILNLLLPAFLLSAFWLYKARRGAAAAGAGRSQLWLLLFLAALIAGTMLMVRQLFHGAILSAPDLSQAESYSYTLAGLLLSVGVILAGIRLPDKALRLAGLLLLVAAIGKTALDVWNLGGLLRILSVLGVGIVGIAMGKLYGTVLRAEAAPARADQA